jgi:hypothetical protein
VRALARGEGREEREKSELRWARVARATYILRCVTPMRAAPRRHMLCVVPLVWAPLSEVWHRSHGLHSVKCGINRIGTTQKG